jgi:predicted nucleic acid-binding protein
LVRQLKDNTCLEPALAANAAISVSSDNDLLVLHPWRGVRILLPATSPEEHVQRGYR